MPKAIRQTSEHIHSEFHALLPTPPATRMSPTSCAWRARRAPHLPEAPLETNLKQTGVVSDDHCDRRVAESSCAEKTYVFPGWSPSASPMVISLERGPASSGCMGKCIQLDGRPAARNRRRANEAQGTKVSAATRTCKASVQIVSAVSFGEGI